VRLDRRFRAAMVGLIGEPRKGVLQLEFDRRLLPLFQPLLIGVTVFGQSRRV
jgi:hypothetical protein